MDARRSLAWRSALLMMLLGFFQHCCSGNKASQMKNRYSSTAERERERGSNYSITETTAIMSGDGRGGGVG